MCRWLGYVGSPIEPRELLYDPERSRIEQSRRPAPDMPVPTGDGFGLGWYGRREVPALFHSATPAWGDRNLHTLASEISFSFTPPPQPAPAPLPALADDSSTVFHVVPQGSTRCSERAAVAGCDADGPSTSVDAAL